MHTQFLIIFTVFCHYRIVHFNINIFFTNLYILIFSGIGCTTDTMMVVMRRNQNQYLCSTRNFYRRHILLLHFWHGTKAIFVILHDGTFITADFICTDTLQVNTARYLNPYRKYFSQQWYSIL